MASDFIYRYKSIAASSNTELENHDDNIENYACVANVIYMDHKGNILDKKSYAGDKGDDIVVEYIDIPGYVYISDTGKDAVFKKTETNIVVNYEKKSSSISIVTIIGSGVIVALVAVAIVMLIRRRKFGQGELDVVEDLFIE